jgi:hypothetical protein
VSTHDKPSGKTGYGWSQVLLLMSRMRRGMR